MKRPQDLTRAPARKALGQHFLFDPDILRRIALAAGSPEGRTVIEIGPGPGGLSRALLDAGVDRLIVVEADARFAAALRDWPEAGGGRLHVHLGDARNADFPALIETAGGKVPAMIIANLPYNVATPLLTGWLKAGPWRGEMALMFQKEVAQRICAAPGERHYGRLAVLSRAVTQPHIAFTLPPGAFRPPPKVDSAVVVFAPLAAAARFDKLDALEQVSAAAFGQRRKMLRAALKPLAARTGVGAETLLRQADIEPSARAETIDQEGFRRLARAFAQAADHAQAAR